MNGILVATLIAFMGISIVVVLINKFKQTISVSKPLHLLFAGFFIGAIIFASSFYSTSTAKTKLKKHFRLPEEISFLDFRRPRRASANKLEGIVQFTNAQFDAYRANLADRNQWKPTSFETSLLTNIGPFSYRALEWQKLPKPPFAGSRRVRWGNLSREEAREIRHGQFLCLAYRNAPDKRQSKLRRLTPKKVKRLRKYKPYRLPKTPANLDKFSAINCAELGRAERPIRYVFGILDFDSRKLHMIVR